MKLLAGGNIGGLLSKPPIHQNKFPTKTSIYTVIGDCLVSLTPSKSSKDMAHIIIVLYHDLFYKIHKHYDVVHVFRCKVGQIYNSRTK